MENIEIFKKQKVGWLIESKLFACPLFEHFKSLEKIWEQAPKDLSKVIDLIKELRFIENDRKNDFIIQRR